MPPGQKTGITLALACTIALLSACGTLEDQAIASAEKAVLAQLKDPSSAKFEEVRIVYGKAITKFSREMYTCGYVNAKNSFGAMAGRTRFVVTQYRTDLNGKSYFTTYDAAFDHPPENSSQDERDPASFDNVYWVHCR